MRRHPGVGAVDLRVVERRLVDARLEIVGDDEPGAALEKREHVDMRADPILQSLCPAHLGVGVVRGAEHGDEELCRANLAGPSVDNRHRLAGIVDEHLVAGHVMLAHRRRQPVLKIAVELAKATVTVAAGMRRAVLLP
jgi:hypothetical protein